MKISQVAVTLYTVNQYCRTASDLTETLKKIAKIGLKAVQISAIGPIDEAEVVRILDGEGLTCCATHEPADKILSTPMAVVERLKKLNCKATAYPFPANIDLSSSSAVTEWIKKLNEAGKVFYDNGLILMYHNHTHEFLRSDGKLILERVYDETDPRYLQSEIDTCWVQLGGGDPVDWCARMKNRLPVLHMKDAKVIMKDGNPQAVPAEIGQGGLPWKNIVRAADDAGCEWYVIEQDGYFEKDAFESIRTSFEYIKATLCK